MHYFLNFTKRMLYIFAGFLAVSDFVCTYSAAWVTTQSWKNESGGLEL
jgi:hypothetical protein